MSYNDFLSATIDQRILNSKERLIGAFRHFDVDDSGYISKNSLKEAMAR